MLLYKSEQWISDIDRVLAGLPELNLLEGKSVLVTGAYGLVCSSVVDFLFRYNDTHEKSIHIYAAGRSMDKMSARFGDMASRPDFTFIPYDASKTDNVLSFYCDYIIHGAGNASPDMVVSEPVETMTCNFIGMKCLLDFAKKYGAERVLFISSSEVYGQKDGNQPYKEDEYGFIDILNPRNSYSVGKRAAETLCASYAAEYGVESVIVRPGHVYGPSASEKDYRVASAWVFAAARGRDIVMKSSGQQLRSCCYCPDCASAILKVLICGRNASAYNISVPGSVISIKEMAGLLSKQTGVRLIQKEAADKEKKGFNPMDNSSLDSTRLLKLGWKALFPAEEGFSHTVSIIKEMYDKNFC